MQFLKFNHLLSTRPHDIHEVFISDLHLAEGSVLVKAFLALLDDLSALPNLNKLYILGDWFDAWVGDDIYLSLNKKSDKRQQANHWITPIVDRLKQLRINGCQILVLTGNRDFLMRQPFCNCFGGQMLSEPHFIQISNQQVRLEHGDALCTDDKAYQRFRKYAHNPFVQWWLLKKPIKKRLKISEKLRQQSKKSNANKSVSIMDVNETAVKYALNPQLDEQLVKRHRKRHKPLPPTSDILIHGHTHRPDIHQLDNGKLRYVLGDWRMHDLGSRYESVTAVIGVVYHDHDEETAKEVYEMVEFEW